jgi:glucan phosphoethanolaminetransferase (alkaline phosphatase superfamily)
MSILWLGLALASAFMFHERYWRWRDCFNELGRCYDTNEGVMTDTAGPIWATHMLIFSLLFLRALWKLLRQQTTPETP